ncbi:hypothetical protein PINS_up017184 [Pythium insidiosum]|nr:hypothetical protein PINS_up017184 [Pythium insidiosum]
MTEHVVTRWYRAPELMLQPDGYYDSSVDMWSVGCIFAEILGRKALFPGKNFLHQLTLIFEVIGTPPADATARIKSSQAQRFLKSLGKKPKVPLRTIFPSASDDALDLLDRLLEFDPAKRLTADEALAHPYMQPIERKYKGVDPIPTARVDFSFDAKKLNKTDLQTLLLKEVERFRAGVAHAAAIDAALSDEDGAKSETSSGASAATLVAATSTPPTTMTPTQLATARTARPQSAQLLSSSRSISRQSTADSIAVADTGRPEMERPASANLSTSAKIGSQRWRIRVAAKPPVPRQTQQLQTARSTPLQQNARQHHVHVVASTDARNLLFAHEDDNAAAPPLVSPHSKSPEPQRTATTPPKSPSPVADAASRLHHQPASPAVEDDDKDDDKQQTHDVEPPPNRATDAEKSVEATAMALSALEQRSRALMSKISATAVTVQRNKSTLRPRIQPQLRRESPAAPSSSASSSSGASSASVPKDHVPLSRMLRRPQSSAGARGTSGGHLTARAPLAAPEQSGITAVSHRRRVASAGPVRPKPSVASSSTEVVRATAFVGSTNSLIRAQRASNGQSLAETANQMLANMSSSQDVSDREETAAPTLKPQRSTTQLGNQQDAGAKRAPKKLTVPKSPKFSVMSWQKKKEMAVAARVAGSTNLAPPVLPIHMRR